MGFVWGKRERNAGQRPSDASLPADRKPTPMVGPFDVLSPGQVVRSREEQHLGEGSSVASLPADTKPDAVGSPFGVLRIRMASICS